MDQIVKQTGNCIQVINKNTGAIIEIIGIQYFSFQFFQGTIQLIDSSIDKDAYGIQLANLYDEGLVNLNTEALALGYITTFTDVPPVIGGVSSVTGDGVDNTDPENPVLTFPTPTDLGLGNVDNTSDNDKPVSTAQQKALDDKVDDTEKGAINGVATLDGTGKVTASQLPPNDVTSVHGRTGAVISANGDYNSDQVTEGVTNKYNQAHTGDVTGATALTISANAVSNGKLAQVPTQTIKGRTTAGTGNAEDLTSSQATALLNTFTPTLKGLVPLSGGGTTNFLRADGVFIAPPGGGGTVASVGEVNTGTDNIKFISPLAIEGSKYLDQSGAKISATASGVNNYLTTIAPAITSYVSSQIFYIKFTSANTGATTINVNGLGVKTLVKNGNAPLELGDIVNGQIHAIAYDGANFQIVGEIRNRVQTVQMSLGTIISSGSASSGYTLDGNEMTYFINGANPGVSKIIYLQFVLPADYKSGGTFSFSLNKTATLTTLTATAYVDNLPAPGITGTPIEPTASGVYELKTASFSSNKLPGQTINLRLDFTGSNNMDIKFRTIGFNYQT